MSAKQHEARNEKCEDVTAVLLVDDVIARKRGPFCLLREPKNQLNVSGPFCLGLYKKSTRNIYYYI